VAAQNKNKISTMMADIPERDWKLLRELKTAALERLCGRILRRTNEVITAPGATNHQRFLNLWKTVQEQNEEVALAFDDHRRSTAFLKILQMHRTDLFTEEEFARFSEETRQRVLLVESL
jgi:hypothetical protein